MALVADSTKAMRGLLTRTLTGLGYGVLGVSDAAELARQVHAEDVLLCRALLLVLDAQLASQCAVPISVAATRRWQMHRASAKVILIYEWGTLGVVGMPELHHCEMLAVLETPFHLQELASVAKVAVAGVA
jgi:DNA-binding NtrC family response regulator